MEKNDAEIQEIFDSPSVKRRLRRRSSLYGSPLLKSEIVSEDTKLQYVAQLQNEKLQWIRLQETILANNRKVEPPLKCNFNHLNTELRNFCNDRHDLVKFAADTNALAEKLEFYTRMEGYAVRKVKYAEDRLKQRVNDITAKLFVDQVEEKIYL
ncbi:uncharacterized protein LOC119081840 [Bradysia coprophila]|uniref:uncharacterized protein LOC119081840 n=1 Tax=Bradysia coprophila TaxID=38358 RepID=UPI00187DB64B|nr:uncharacterized protein LOC119081840 [Bradysia coprophila]